MTQEEFAKQNIFGQGEPNVNFAQYFIGNSYLNWLGSQSGVGIANVTFAPGCRNNFHIHHATSGGGQILLCIAGHGLYGEENGYIRELNPGDVVLIPAEKKHWHGAAPDSWFSHIAIELPGTDTLTEWCEEVSDEQYNKYKEGN